MLVLTHLVAAAIPGRASRMSTAWLVVGAAVPDLIDKPLGMVGVVELFHSVGHSGSFVVCLLPVALYTQAGIAVVVGWSSHLLLDVGHVLINGRPGHALVLLWPLTGSADPLGLPPGEFLRLYLGTPSFYLELVVWVLVAGLLVRGRLSDWSRS